MSVCIIIRADCPVDNPFFTIFSTEPDGSMAGVHAASEVASGATTEAFCFARSQAARFEVSYD